jgi:hypothetical protein
MSRKILTLAAISLAVSVLAPGAAGSAAAAVSDTPIASAASILASPCFGAPARNPIARCIDSRLRLTVYPTPDDAVLQPAAPCQQLAQGNIVNPCKFGVSGSAKPTVALIGDSHAGHWRPAVDVVARATGVSAVSITRSGCPFTYARVVIAEAGRAAACQSWTRATLAWLESHREITTVFVSQRASAPFVRTRGASNFDTAVSGYAALMQALPATVTSVIVIRDTPLDSAVAQDCVRRLHAEHQPVNIRCARPRAKALRPDPAAAAARRLRGRVHVLDMTPFFCSSAVCYPVVGGALVHKDADHMTLEFAKTLGPFMIGKIANIVRSAAS